MPVIKIINQTTEQVSTSIGAVTAGVGQTIIVQYDEVPIPYRLYKELEALRQYNRIDYSVLEDPNVRDEVELAPYGVGLGKDFDKIGIPTDGSYLDGYFDWWTDQTKIADAVDEISETMLQLIPAKAGVLSGQTLALSGVTTYSARIPSGNAGSWPTPGSLITNLIITNTYRFDSPDQTTRFRAGKSSDLTTAGVLSHMVNGVPTETYDIGVNGVGTIGNITVNTLSPYNTFWLKATAYVMVTQTVAGRQLHAFQHTEAGLSAYTELVYDDTHPAPAFSGPSTAALNTKVSKWMSGIEAWGFGTIIDIVYTGASGIFEKAYHPTAVGVVACVGHTTSTDNPLSTPAFNDQLSVNRTIALNNANQASLAPAVQFTLQKPTGTPATTSASLPAAVNTYGVISTAKTDVFFDEARRIVLNSGTYSGNAAPFVPTALLVDGNAQQRHNGHLQYPDTTDYPGFSGDQEYQRFIAKASASTGLLTFSGLTTVASQISRYNTGALNVLIHLSTSGKYFDLGLSVGAFNGTGSGNSRADSVGARNDSLTSGNVLAWSLGTASTAFNNNEYRIIIIFKNSTLFVSGISEV